MGGLGRGRLLGWSGLALYLFHQLLLLLQAMAGDVSVSGSRFTLHFCYGSSLFDVGVMVVNGHGLFFASEKVSITVGESSWTRKVQ